MNYRSFKYVEGVVLKNIGSTLALVIAFFMFLGNLSNLTHSKGSANSSIASMIIVLTALSYRSAKWRFSNNDGTYVLRRIVEFFAFALAMFLSFARNDLKVAIATDPFPSFIIPAWCIAAYLYINFKIARAAHCKDAAP